MRLLAIQARVTVAPQSVPDIAANRERERLIHRLIEPSQVIDVAQIWRWTAVAPKSEHARPESSYSATTADRSNPDTAVPFPVGRGETRPSHHARPPWLQRLSICRPAVRRSDQTPCPTPSREECVRHHPASRPDRRLPVGHMPRERFPLDDNAVPTFARMKSASRTDSATIATGSIQTYLGDSKPRSSSVSAWRRTADVKMLVETTQTQVLPSRSKSNGDL